MPPSPFLRKPTRFFSLGHTGLTVLWVLDQQNSVQSLLDTTPPKRVPILWDGSAPAPSTLPRATGMALPQYKLIRISRASFRHQDRGDRLQLRGEEPCFTGRSYSSWWH